MSLSVVQQVQQLIEDGDKDMPSLTNIESSTESSFADVNKYKDYASSAFENSPASTPKEKSCHQRLSTTKAEPPESAVTRDEADTTSVFDSDSEVSSDRTQKRATKLVTSRQRPHYDLDTDSESGDEPFMVKLLRQAEKLRNMKSRIDRKQSFDESDSVSLDSSENRIEFDPESNIDFCAIFQCTREGIIVDATDKVAPMTQENLNRMTSEEIAAAASDLSTVGKPMSKKTIEPIFSRGVLPQTIPVYHDADDISTLRDGTFVSRGFRAGSLASIHEASESEADDRRHPGLEPQRRNAWTKFRKVEIAFAVLTVASTSALIILIVVFVV